MALSPLLDAIASISAKTPLGTTLRSNQIKNLPLALRQRAQLSAAVTSIRLLATIQNRLQRGINLQKEQLANGKSAFFDRSSFIDEIRQMARDEGIETIESEGERGSVKDIRSIPRLGLIFDMQNSQANGYARWKLDQSEGALMEFPAWEFTRVEHREKHREGWPERWAEAGGEVIQDRMVALKTDPVWRRLSIFGTPWPPFDWGSGMGVEEVDYDEAVALGLIKEGDIPEATGEEEFNDEVKASLKNVRPEFKSMVRDFMGKDAIISGDDIEFQ